MNPNHPTANFLRRHRRRARGTLLVWSMAATVGALAFFLGANLAWIKTGNEWTLAAVAVALLLLVIWFRGALRLTTRQLARDLDRRWGLQARLESAVELSASTSALAAAQRDEATHQLTGRNPPGAFGWFAGNTAMILASLMVVFEGVVLVSRTAPTGIVAATPPATPTTAVDARASIEWKSPQSEIKATAIEEVPLTALAESSTGFRALSLEVVINGEREVSRPLDAPAPETLVATGAHELTPSLYLDELQLKDGDIVTYRLVAELNLPEKRVVSSPLQFVEIRRVRNEAGLGGGRSEIVEVLLEVKAKQLQLVKQNFALAQLAGPAADPTWATENTRVASEQEAVAGRTEYLITLFQQGPAPAEIIDRLGVAKSLMREAARQIAATKNEPALKPQNRALAIITDIAKLINPSLAGASAAADPIRDEQRFKLPSRSETPAGELEQLAERQRQNNQQLANGVTGANAETGAAAQTAIARDAEKLAAGGTFDSAVGQVLESAAAAAAEAARQWSLGDRAAARVPAGEAERGFEQAVAAQEKAGRAAAAAELEQLRRTLNQASRAGRASERAEKLNAVRDALRAVAIQQQRSGSADAAREIAFLAEVISATKGAKDTPAVVTTEKDSSERAREVALAAARIQIGLTSRGAALSRAVRMLNRVSQSPQTGVVDRIGGSPADLEIATQEAQWITGDASTIDLARQIATQADALQRSAADRMPPRETLEAVVKLVAALERGRLSDDRDAIVRHFNPADVEPAYRAAVENYFERLSRDGRRTSTQPGR